MIVVDTSNHWRYVTGRETVVYRARTASGIANVGVNVPNAKRWPKTKDRELADALLRVDRVKWSFWRNQLSGTLPKPGDAFVDADGYTFVIQTVDSQAPGQNADGSATPPQRFDCQCIMSQM